ncbi:MAG: ABC transporter substrate-binding protein [Verrucomicrobia bacterium]|nr:ABC transporter substrate-binding protein [Verrucomicrobiota bacterium]
MKRKNSLKMRPVELGRRSFLRHSATALLLSGVPTGWAGRLFADDSPETADIRFGIIALTDCSPFVIGAEKGFFAKHGIRPTIAKGANWAAIRDALSNGDNQATHMLLGMPLASSMGLLGSPKKPMVIPWLVNRNGQAISLKADLKGAVQDDPRALKPIADKAKSAGTPMSFAMTFPPGTHAMWLRYFLGAGGIHPDRDVSLLTIPPPQMVANMKIGKMDGFCVGEPWNARAVADGIGFTAITSQKIWPDHPEKVCAFTAEFADKNPRTVKAILKGLHEASVWLDNPSNRAEQCEIVSRPAYINCPREIIFGRLGGTYDMGDGRTFQDDHPMIFSVRNCNYPQPKYAKWWLSQFRRWGMVQGAPDYEGVARTVFRPDLFSDAMKELGVTPAGPDNRPETLFDGKTFDPGQPEAYAASFEVHSRKD